MIRRKPTHPGQNGGSAGNSGYGQVGYASPQLNQGGYGHGHGLSVGVGADVQTGGGLVQHVHGYGYGSPSSATSAPIASAAPRYAGYGTSTGTGTASSSSGSFGVGMGGEASYGLDDRASQKGKKKRNSRSFGSTAPIMSLAFLMNKVVILSIIATIMLGMTIYYRSQYKLILDNLHVQTISEAVKSYKRLELDKQKFQREITLAKDGDRNMKNSIRELEKTNRELRKQQDELKVKFETNGGLETEQVKKLKARDGAWRKQVYLLQNATQRESQRAVLERFGPGPHHILFSIEIPTETDSMETGTFKVELAPLDTMPHATHLFLEQVHNELWDGTWFYLNGPHVLQAGPQDWDDETAGQSIKRFTDARLDKLIFPEYSPTFPHDKWTLGYTGRPGGRDWYINKQNNTISHGPHGQSQFSLDEQADSCFGIVVEGQDVLEKVFSMAFHPRGSGYDYFLEVAVEIVSARIVEPLASTIQKPKQTVAGATSAANFARKAKLPQRRDVNREALDDAEAAQIAEILNGIEAATTAGNVEAVAL